jgi:peptidoglycan hydrolase-like protein with peptidoglycan-binding domain
MASKSSGTSKNSGTGLIVVVLLGALAFAAGSDGEGAGGSNGTGAGGDGGLASGVQGWESGGTETCDGTTEYDSPSGTYQIPTDEPDDLFDARDCELSVGRGGAGAVVALQDALTRCHGQPLDLDGTYGQETSDAVRAVQSEHDIGADGAYGPETSNVIRWPTTSPEGNVTCAAHPA